MTYVGIGSCPHASTLEELTDEWDQILPVFIRESKATIFHYDPAFEYKQEFMKQYFEAKGFDTTAMYRDYLTELEAGIALDTSSANLSFAPRPGTVLIGYDNIPDSGYGSS